MENKNVNNYNNNGVTFFGILTIVFIVLKLTHVIDWSWVWVLSPLWVSAIITIIVLFIFIKIFDL